MYETVLRKRMVTFIFKKENIPVLYSECYRQSEYILDANLNTQSKCKPFKVPKKANNLFLS